MAFIEDGQGRGLRASVSGAQRLNVSAKTRRRIFYVSRDDKRAFNAVATAMNVAAGEYAFYIKNTSSSRNMFIDSIEYHSVNDVRWIVWEVTGTAASGETVNPTNMNIGSNVAAEADCMKGDTAITGLSTVSSVGTHRSSASDASAMDWGDSLILPPGSAIAIEYDSGTTGECSIDCLFFYEDVSRSN